MGSKKLSLVFYCFWSIFIVQNLVNAFDKQCTSNRDCLKSNEICSRQSQQCNCKEGTIRFAGDCLGSSQYGDKCQQQYECSQSGDGHLHCINKVCKCGNERIYDQKTKKCEKNKNRGSSKTKQNGYHFNKMTPRQPGTSVVTLDDKYKHIKNVG